MSEGMSELEKNIKRFEGILEELNFATRDAHAVLKDMREERRIVERMMHDDVKKRVNDKTDKVVRDELERIGPEVRKRTVMIYERVDEQIQKVIDIALGKELSTKKGKKDLRPILAEKLREFINEEEKTPFQGNHHPECPLQSATDPEHNCQKYIDAAWEGINSKENND